MRWGIIGTDRISSTTGVLAPEGFGGGFWGSEKRRERPNSAGIGESYERARIRWSNWATRVLNNNNKKKSVFEEGLEIYPERRETHTHITFPPPGYRPRQFLYRFGSCQLLLRPVRITNQLPLLSSPKPANLVGARRQSIVPTWLFCFSVSPPNAQFPSAIGHCPQFPSHPRLHPSPLQFISRGPRKLIVVLFHHQKTTRRPPDSSSSCLRPRPTVPALPRRAACLPTTIFVDSPRPVVR